MVNAEILNRKDALTGFHTKEGLHEYLSSKLTSVYDKVKNLSVVILDLDNFKGINDTYGHLVGDDALRFFATTINTALKGQHFVARYGGDEFVIVMEDTPDGKSSLETANRIKGLLKKDKFVSPVGQFNIGTSIGIASYPRDAKSGRELIDMADQALYYVKKHGRNKVVSSRNLRTHSAKDRILLYVKLVILVFFAALVYFSYQGTASLKGLMTYFDNLQNYFSFQFNRVGQGKNFCTIDLKDGKKLKGWLVSEDFDHFYIAIAKPKLTISPLTVHINPPIKVPKSLVLSYQKSVE